MTSRAAPASVSRRASWRRRRQSRNAAGASRSGATGLGFDGGCGHARSREGASGNAHDLMLARATKRVSHGEESTAFCRCGSSEPAWSSSRSAGWASGSRPYSTATSPPICCMITTDRAAARTEAPPGSECRRDIRARRGSPRGRPRLSHRIGLNTPCPAAHLISGQPPLSGLPAGLLAPVALCARPA